MAQTCAARAHPASPAAAAVDEYGTVAQWASGQDTEITQPMLFREIWSDPLQIILPIFFLELSQVPLGLRTVHCLHSTLLSLAKSERGCPAIISIVLRPTGPPDRTGTNPLA